MLIWGWILSVIGVSTTVVASIAYNEANSSMYGFYKYYDSSLLEAAVIAIVIGIILILAGLIMLLIGYKRQYDNKMLLKTKKCIKCGSVTPLEVCFCSRCGSKF